MITQTRKITFVARGGHSPGDVACAMEWVAILAAEPWSEQPQCASEVIGAFVRRWNDAMDDEDRQQLIPIIPTLIGTAASAAVERRRSWMALDWAVRVSAPAWLRAAKSEDDALAVEACGEIRDTASAKAAQAALERLKSEASSAGDAGAAVLDAAARAAWWATAEVVDWVADWAGADWSDDAITAAGDARRSTMEHLQREALALIARMVAVTE